MPRLGLSPRPTADERAVATRLRSLQIRLQAAPTLAALLAVASAEALEFCGFERAVVLRITTAGLTGVGVDPLADPASDGLRRAASSAAIPLSPGSPEAEVVRRADGARDTRPTQPSRLAAQLQLREHAIAAVTPESRALALVVVDRESPAASQEDIDALHLFAHLLGYAVDRAVQRMRMQELTAEMRHLTTSATALLQEAQNAPLALPEDYGNGPVFGQVIATPAASESVRALLSEREADVIDLMLEGLSNRQIGERLNLSPSTVKDHVARILSKLGATNRVDAVGIYLRLAARTHQSAGGFPPPGV